MIGLDLIFSKNDLIFRKIIFPMNVSFEKSEHTTIEWLTPPDLVASLGPFDLDPCTPENPPFVHAPVNFTILDNGLKKEWFGRVFMNPPYGKGLELWMEKLKFHGNGIALIFARTETKLFFNHVWDAAHGMLFVKGRIKFFNLEGKLTGTPGAPSVFIAYGSSNADALEHSGIAGKFIRLR
jgi:hypothetical protein